MAAPANNLKLIIDNENYSLVDCENSREQFWPLIGLSLGTFLQAICLDQHTFILEICRERDRGRLFFIQGYLHNAEWRDLHGEEAALEMGILGGCEIQYQKSSRPIVRTEKNNEEPYLDPDGKHQEER